MDNNKSDNNFEYSEYQKDIFNWVQNDTGNAIIQAYAGSSKTTVLVECANLIKTGNNLFVAFNKKIQLELQEKLPDSMKAMTLHALGYSLIMSQITVGNKVDIDNKKVMNILKSMNLDIDRKEFFTLINIVKNIKNQFIDYNDKKQLDDLFIEMRIEEIVREDWYSIIKSIMTKSNNQIFKIDFEDMIYFPLIKNVKKSPKNWIFVDECQDLNNAQMSLLDLFIGNSTRLLIVGDKFQCQPKGTKVTMGYVNGSKIKTKNIEDIKIGDKLLTYSLSTHCTYRTYSEQKYMNKYCRKVKNISKRIYDDDLIVIESNNKITKYTKEHKCIARLSKDFNDKKYTLYLMKRNTNFRIGICPAMMKGDNLGIGARMRMNQEKADAVWILDIFDNRKEALQKEMYYSIKYNIPMILFNQRHQENSYTQEFIDNIWKEFYSMSEMQNNANNILKHFKRDINYPLFTNMDIHTHFSRNHCFTLTACNLISQYMEVNHFDGKNKFEKNKGSKIYKYRAKYHKINKLWYEKYEDFVYSLEVETDKNYIADGILTHNCIYAFRGSIPTIMDDSKKKYNMKEFTLPITYRCPKSHISIVKSHVPNIEAFEHNEFGIVDEIEYEKLPFSIEDDAVFIARTNKYVAETVMLLLKNKKKATALGKDIGTNLIKYIKSYRCYNLRDFIGELHQNNYDNYDNIQKYEKLLKTEQDFTKTGSYRKRINMLQYDNDVIETIIVLSEECTTINELNKLIEEIFSDNIKGIICSTIHKIKGLEFDNVYVLQNKLPMKFDFMSEIELEQEQNCWYVAHTRSKHKLVLVHKNEKKK